jgi:GMP synthase (glutamine-hydrolysing)
MKPVLILQHDVENPCGFVGDLLDEYRIAYDVVMVEKEAIPDPAHYQAIIAFGGAQHVYEEESHPYFAQEKVLLRSIVDQDIPYLGICLGGQLLASTLGSDVQRHTITEIGFFTVELTQEGKQDPLFAGLAGYQKVFHWHEDTFDLPEGALLLATSATTTNQAFRYGPRAYGLQYHIEITEEMLASWLHHFDMERDIINTPGIEIFTQVKQDYSLHFSTYHVHTRILFTNFLSICGLV